MSYNIELIVESCNGLLGSGKLINIAATIFLILLVTVGLLSRCQQIINLFC